MSKIQKENLSQMKKTCFVMQPFDNGSFDKRYDSIFKPAINAACIEPYRVDHDPSVSLPIQEIESGIRNSTICFADISTDNPNVWFELGFALAIPKEVVIICSDERKTKYPFDVQHRTITKYATGSPQDFNELEKKITERIIAILKKNEPAPQAWEGVWYCVWKSDIEKKDSWVIDTVEFTSFNEKVLISVVEKGDVFDWQAICDFESPYLIGTWHSKNSGALARGVVMLKQSQQGDVWAGYALGTAVKDSIFPQNAIFARSKEIAIAKIKRFDSLL